MSGGVMLKVAVMEISRIIQIFSTTGGRK
jgi:hypothetical protein